LGFLKSKNSNKKEENKLMSFYSLPIERYNIKVPEEYCYLVIRKYTDKNFQPQDDKKKLSSQELKEKKERLINQQNTIKQLETGYCNLYNNKIKLDNINGSFFVSYLEDENELIYKIKPVASREIRENHYSWNDKNYETSEFNVIKKFSNKEEVIQQIYEDKLLNTFAATVFDSLSYGNEGYDQKLYRYFEYFQKTFNNCNISLSDIMLTDDYNHMIRSKFNRKDTYELTRINIRYLLDNGLVKHFREGDYYKNKLIIGLIECGLYDVALDCVKQIEEYDLEYLLKDKDFEIVLRKWSNINEVKEIISLLDIKLKGVTLKVIKDYYGSKSFEEKTFNNISEVKTYLIKNYDISFEQVMNKDVCDLDLYDGDTEIKFEVI